LKLAYIVSLFPKISETFILREMEALRARGVEITVLSLKNRKEEIAHPEAEVFSGATIYAGSPLAAFGALAGWLVREPAAVAAVVARVVGSHAAHPVLLAKSLPALLTAAWAARRLRALGVDRVHAHWATYPALAAWAIRRLTGIPYSITAHAHDIFLANPLLSEKIDGSDFTVTISEYNRKVIGSLCGGGIARKLHVVHCGIPLGLFPQREAEPGPPARVVSVGRMVDYKGFGTLLRAVARLRGEGRDLSCDIVGDGPLRGEIEAEVERRGLRGCVRLLGSLTQGEVRAALAGATACVLASERGHDGQMDGIPVVLMEAMALGVPSVATRISGIPEILEDGRTGLLAEPGDPASLAAALARVLDDPGLARRIASEGRRKVEAEFDIERSAESLLKLMGAAAGGGD